MGPLYAYLFLSLITISPYFCCDTCIPILGLSQNISSSLEGSYFHWWLKDEVLRCGQPAGLTAILAPNPNEPCASQHIHFIGKRDYQKKEWLFHNACV